MNKIALLSDKEIINKIYVIRGVKVMIDRDLAELYGVETKALKQAVKRNITRFPLDFMFELSEKEFSNLRSQIVTSNSGGTRYMPIVFTEQGVAMLSSLLKSEKAVFVNIQIIRIFTRFKEMALSHKDILLKLEKLEKEVGKNTTDIQLIFSALKQLLTKPETPRKSIGYKVPAK